ncbi:hypothetical protein ACN28E_52230 [Archangium lansingense]|uniref:hypothetical protein n=1 Tax=Archangium lansingense TaxID=2995310 RepID=UPI003B769248
MRWKFPDPKEAAAREQLLARIDAWWQAFAAQTPRLNALFLNKEQWDLPAWMREHLESIHPGLMWEYGAGLKGGHRLVITPESSHYLCPLVEVILARAPVLPGWEFYPWRLPEAASMALQVVQARTGVDVSGYQARATANEDGTVDITYTPRSLLSRLNPFRTQDPALNGALIVATEALVGEELLNTRIGAISVESRGDGVPLEALASEVRARILALDEKLPSSPFHTQLDEASWTLYELKPTQHEDYPGRLDLFVANTMAPALWASAHSVRPFSSRRFSRHGETFCYLKLDGSEGLGEGGFKDRAEVEDALNEALVPAGLGCVIGGGTGVRYSYVDLALMNVERAMSVMRDVLQRGKVPRRTWLLFFDSALGAEWLPIWEDAPPPFLPADAD